MRRSELKGVSEPKGSNQQLRCGVYVVSLNPEVCRKRCIQNGIVVYSSLAYVLRFSLIACLYAISSTRDCLVSFSQISPPSPLSHFFQAMP